MRKNDEEEGFLGINNEILWTFNQDTDDWEQANVVGHRRVKAGKGKGKGKRRYKKQIVVGLNPLNNQAKHTLQKTKTKPTGPGWTHRHSKQVGKNRIMAKESRIVKAVREKPKERAISSQAISKAKKRILQSLRTR